MADDSNAVVSGDVAGPDDPTAQITVETMRPGDSTFYPKAGQTCRVHYVGMLKADGRKFDSSRDRGMHFHFTLGTGQVIKGWEEALPQMSRGQIAKVTVPPAKAYGVRGYPPIIPPNATLVYEIELISFADAENAGQYATALQERGREDDMMTRGSTTTTS